LADLRHSVQVGGEAGHGPEIIRLELDGARLAWLKRVHPIPEVVDPHVNSRDVRLRVSPEQAERRALTVQPIPAILVIEPGRLGSIEQVQPEQAVLRSACSLLRDGFRRG
jgi:hypothetical protein